MSELRGRSVPESHLLPDAVVAFVDAELSLGAHERAAAHIASCSSCAAEVSAQRQARTAVRGAAEPTMSAGFLADLRSIPQSTELGGGPDNLAVTDDGELVSVQRPERLPGVRSVRPGESHATHDEAGGALGADGSADPRRRTAQGAGVVASGLVLSALALVLTGGLDGYGESDPAVPQRPDVLPAQFNVPISGSSHGPSSGTSTTSVPGPATSATQVLAPR